MRPEDTEQDRVIRALVLALVAFGGAAGLMALVACLLALVQFATEVGGAVAAAVTGGAGVSISVKLRKGTKR